MSNAEDKGIESPNYTQTPNTLYDDYLPLMGLAELKVVMVVIRQTFGYHKKEDVISLSQLQKATGLSRQGVIDGAAAAIGRGILKRHPHGRSFAYSLIVKPVDQPEKEESTELTIDSQASRPKLVKPVDTQKKERKDSNKKDKDSGASAPPPSEDDDSPKEKTRTPRQQKLRDYAEAICGVTGDDINIKATEKRAGQVASQLIKAEYSIKYIREVFPPWWYANDFRGEKGHRPTVQQVLSEIGRSKASPLSRKNSRGNAMTGAVSPDVGEANEGLRRKIRERQREAKS